VGSALGAGRGGIAVPLGSAKSTMSSIVVWTRQHRLVIFLGLAFALSWWAWPLYVLDLFPTPFFACGPLVAALVVIGMTEGWSATGCWVRFASVASTT
jgi:small neutral amino acid transporter SnatA (MarC family)